MDDLEPNARKTRRRSMRNLRRQSLVADETSNEDCISLHLGLNKEYAGDKEKDGCMFKQYGSLWMETNNLTPAKKLRRRRSSILPAQSVEPIKTDSQEFEIENLCAVEKEETYTNPSVKNSFISPMLVQESIPEPSVCALTIVKDAYPETPVSVFSSEKGLAVSNIDKAACSGLWDLFDQVDESKDAANIDLDTAYTNLDISTSTPTSRANSSIGSLNTSLQSMSPEFPPSPSTTPYYQQENLNNSADSYQSHTKVGDESLHSVSQSTQMLEYSNQCKDREEAKTDRSHNDSKNDSLGSSFLSMCRTLAVKVASLMRISPQGGKTSKSEFYGNEMGNSPILHERDTGNEMGNSPILHESDTGNEMGNSPILHESDTAFKEADNSSSAENIKSLLVMEMTERDGFQKSFLMQGQQPNDAVGDKSSNTSVIVAQKLSSFDSVEKQLIKVEDSSGPSLTKKKPVKRKSSVSKAFLDTFRAVSEELNKDRNGSDNIVLDKSQGMAKKLSDDKSKESVSANKIQTDRTSDRGGKFDRPGFDSLENDTLDLPVKVFNKEFSSEDVAFTYSSEMTTQEVEDTWNVLGLDTGIVDDKIVNKIGNRCESPKVLSHISTNFPKQNDEMIFKVKEENTEEQIFKRESYEQTTVQFSFTQLKKSLENTPDAGNIDNCTQSQINTGSSISTSLATFCKEQYSGQENVNENVTETCESCMQESNSSKDMPSESAKTVEQRDDEEANRVLDFLTMEDSSTSSKDANQSATRKRKRRSELIFLQENYGDSMLPDVEMNNLEQSGETCGRGRRRRRSADRAVMKLLQGSTMAQLEQEEAEILSKEAKGHESDSLVNDSNEPGINESLPSEKMSNSRTGRKKTQEVSTALQDISNANTSGVTGRNVKKRGKDLQETSLEELYRNKNYKKPEGKMWETIYEQPDSVNSKAEEQIFSKKRYQRVAMFEKPTQLKLRRRLQKAIKNGWDPKTRKRMALPHAVVEEKIANLEIQLNSKYL